MSKNYIQDYTKAGKAVIAAKKIARKIVIPGALLLDITKQCEAAIMNSGCELAVPVNLCLDNIAAHYSSPLDDQTTVPEKGLFKIDCGAHFNGYIADSAITININEDPKLQNYIDAADEALEAAIAKFQPGTKLYELGEAIASKIINYGLRPITNLGGHELRRFNLHAGPFIPNYKEKTHDQVLKPGDAYACEPFATSGIGKVVNGKQTYIYRFKKKAKKGLSYEHQGYMSKIEKYTNDLPFSPRLLESKNLIPKDKIKRTIEFFVGKHILDFYPILIEKTGEPVAQQEHTIILDLDGKRIVTTR